MKTHRLILAVSILCVCFSSVAFATCIPQKTFTNFNTVENPGSYYYVPFGDLSITSADFVGRFWETGNRSGVNEGSYDDALWLLDSYYFPGTDKWYLNGNLGDGGVAGCPVISMTLTVEDQKNGQFVSMAIFEDLPRTVTYDFSKIGADTPLVPIPRPRLTRTQRLGDGNVEVDIAADDASAGVFNGDTSSNADITSHVIYVANVTNGTVPTDPFDHDVVSGGWTQLAVAANGGSALGVVIDCQDASTDRAVAAGMEIDGVAPTTVGARTIVECDSNLADPSGKFKLIDRPAKPGKGKPIKRR